MKYFKTENGCMFTSFDNNKLILFSFSEVCAFFELTKNIWVWQNGKINFDKMTLNRKIEMWNKIKIYDAFNK